MSAIVSDTRKQIERHGRAVAPAQAAGEGNGQHVARPGRGADLGRRTLRVHGRMQQDQVGGMLAVQGVVGQLRITDHPTCNRAAARERTLQAAQPGRQLPLSRLRYHVRADALSASVDHAAFECP